jgi:Protein of unknown function (DUF3592)
MSKSSNHNHGMTFVFIILIIGVFSFFATVYFTIHVTTERDKVKQNEFIWITTPARISTVQIDKYRVYPMRGSSTYISYRVIVSYQYTFSNKSYQSSQMFSGNLHDGDGEGIGREFSPNQLSHCYVNPADPTQSVLRR